MWATFPIGYSGQNAQFCPRLAGCSVPWGLDALWDALSQGSVSHKNKVLCCRQVNLRRYCRSVTCPESSLNHGSSEK